jgi:hypothetical protein
MSVTSRQANGQLKLLGVLPDRLLETVEQFLKAIPGETASDSVRGLHRYVRRLCERSQKSLAGCADHS